MPRLPTRPDACRAAGMAWRKPRYGLINDRPRPGQIMICQIEILAASKYLHAEISTEPAAPLYSSRPLARPMRDGQTRSPRKTMSLETQGSVHTYFQSPSTQWVGIGTKYYKKVHF